MKFFISVMTAIMLAALPVNSFAKTKKLKGPQVVEIADLSIELNGLVCDFCSIALNKTFQKRAEVHGTYVDLNTKIMSVALSPNATLSNEDIIELVKKAGYSTLKITRKDGSEFIPSAKP